ncbi:MAG TPA: hypothetical protein VN368_00760, partial [Candidatus Methylomirabilis sp.]|nr:hypothetical protein [Candidatus Methylomirabilis sp.]
AGKFLPVQYNGRHKMSKFLEFLDMASYLLFMLVLYFLSVISKRLGEVMGLKRYYRIYYLGMFFILLSSIIIFFGTFANRKIFGYFFLAIGLTLSLVVTVKYWGWLIKELLKG